MTKCLDSRQSCPKNQDLADQARSIESALVDLARETAGYQTLAELLRGLSDHLRHIAAFDHLGLALYRPETDALELVLVEPEDLPHRLPPVVPESYPAARVFRTQQSAAYDLTDSK